MNIIEVDHSANRKINPQLRIVRIGAMKYFFNFDSLIRTTSRFPGSTVFIDFAIFDSPVLSFVSLGAIVIFRYCNKWNKFTF